MAYDNRKEHNEWGGMKGKPKKVIQREYTKHLDSTFTAKGEPKRRTMTEFDSMGNAILFESEVPDGYHTVDRCSFTHDGKQWQKIETYLPDGSVKRTEGRMVWKEGGTYKNTVTFQGKPWYTETIEFSVTGDTITNTQRFAENGNKKIIIWYFKDGKAIKHKFWANPKLVQEYDYYYSQDGYLDKVVGSYPEYPTLVDYEYNEKGLPSQVVYWRNGRETAKQDIKYMYDDRGNWVKKLISYIGDAEGIYGESGTAAYTAYALFERTIHY